MSEGSNNTELTYTYDAAGRIATMTDYFNTAYSYTWTDRGELASITRGNYVWEFAYNALGQRTQYTHPNGMRTEYEYDNWNRLEGIYHINASTEAVLDSFEYTLNDGNEITRIDSADGSNWRYAYDDRGRLETALWYSNGDSLEDYYDYTYDDADNMTQYWRWNYTAQTTDIWDYVYNGANQQTSMTLNSGTAETRTYDDWGRLTARAQGAYSAAYTYRYGDRLRQVTSSFPGETATSPVYEYGGDGKLRFRGSEELKYGLGFNPVIDRTNILQVKSFVYEPHKQVSERLAYIGVGFDTNKQYYCHDHLGSVRRTRSSAKGSLAVWDYEPYGKVHSGTATPLIFALHPYESGMGFFTAPYRNYSPAMARWTTVDPAGMVDGPNMYGYVGGNPVKYKDYLGLHKPIPPICVGSILNDYRKQMMDDNTIGNDKYFHCLGHCEAKKQCGNNAVADFWLWTYEIIREDLWGRLKGDPRQDAADDRKANYHGKTCPKDEDCKNRCKGYVVNGINEKYL